MDSKDKVKEEILKEFEDTMQYYHPQDAKGHHKWQQFILKSLDKYGKYIKADTRKEIIASARASLISEIRKWIKGKVMRHSL